MSIIDKAEPEAIYNLLLYLLEKDGAKEGETISQALANTDTSQWDDKARNQFAKRLNIVQNAFSHNPALADSIITDYTANYNNKQGGMTACAITDPSGAVHIIFAGTGAGEWIDNGEGLSGIPQYNLYATYDKLGHLLYSTPAANDYATEQQAEALNWFNKLCSQNNWNKGTPVIVSGHSKGGNKAQFVAINSDLPTECYSFDGQGFSPEAIEMFKAHFPDYNTRRSRIYSISADNDYVNVLGERLVPQQNIFFLQSSDIDDNPFAYHYMETLLNPNGRLNPESPQDEISRYIQDLSRTVMSMPPEERRHITLSIMSLFQHILGGGTPPVNGDYVSDSDTVKGLLSALVPTIADLLFTRDGKEAAAEIAEMEREKLDEKAAEILTGIFTRLKGQ